LTTIFASPAATQKLKPIGLKDGATAHEPAAIASAMFDKNLGAFKYYVEESHFIYGSSCADKTNMLFYRSKLCTI
jgi:hypothetical protein